MAVGVSPGELRELTEEELTILAREIREGLTESRWVSLQATADVMRILDTVRAQIGLHYNDLET